jgi:hypothetical protein
MNKSNECLETEKEETGNNSENITSLLDIIQVNLGLDGE